MIVWLCSSIYIYIYNVSCKLLKHYISIASEWVDGGCMMSRTDKPQTQVSLLRVWCEVGRRLLPTLDCKVMHFALWIRLEIDGFAYSFINCLINISCVAIFSAFIQTILLLFSPFNQVQWVPKHNHNICVVLKCSQKTGSNILAETKNGCWQRSCPLTAGIDSSIPVTLYWTSG